MIAQAWYYAPIVWVTTFVTGWLMALGVSSTAAYTVGANAIGIVILGGVVFNHAECYWYTHGPGMRKFYKWAGQGQGGRRGRGATDGAQYATLAP